MFAKHLSEKGMSALTQGCKHTCKTLEYQTLSLWCHQELGQLVLHLREGCPNWRAPLHLCTNACSLQTQRLSPYEASIPQSKPHVSPGPGEVDLGQRATGMEAGASGLQVWKLGPACTTALLLHHGETWHKRSNSHTWSRGFQNQQQRDKTHRVFLLRKHRFPCNFSLYDK